MHAGNLRKMKVNQPFSEENQQVITIFYINNCCKNNKFELLLQSLFDIINLEGLFA